MESPTGTIELFGDGAWTLDKVFDSATGTYFVPWMADEAVPLLRGASRMWKSQGLHRMDPPDANAPLAAILDTGMLTGHPLLRPRIVASMDFAGEGAEDRNGHGTHVAILFTLSAPNSRFLNVKVWADDDAPIAQKIARIASGVRWAVSRDAKIIGLSLGFRRKCGTHETELCAAIRDAVEQDVLVVVSAEARCPAECDPGVMVAGQWHQERGVEIANTAPSVDVLLARERVRVVPFEMWARHVENSEGGKDAGD